jgi:hypothetical protein
MTDTKDILGQGGRLEPVKGERVRELADEYLARHRESFAIESPGPDEVAAVRLARLDLDDIEPGRRDALLGLLTPDDIRAVDEAREFLAWQERLGALKPESREEMTRAAGWHPSPPSYPAPSHVMAAEAIDEITLPPWRLRYARKWRLKELERLDALPDNGADPLSPVDLDRIHRACEDAPPVMLPAGCEPTWVHAAPTAVESIAGLREAEDRATVKLMALYYEAVDEVLREVWPSEDWGRLRAVHRPPDHTLIETDEGVALLEIDGPRWEGEVPNLRFAFTVRRL